MKVCHIHGGSHSDLRGGMRFCNDFDLTPVKRFYTISNSAAEPKRGWFMHKRETKWFFPLIGRTKVEVEGQGQQRMAYLLDASEPAILMVPPDNWFLIEQDGAAEVQVFSNCYLHEFPGDDFRRPQ